MHCYSGYDHGEPRNLKVLALGTGSKCIGTAKLNKEGITFGTLHVVAVVFCCCFLRLPSCLSPCIQMGVTSVMPDLSGCGY